MNFIFLILVLFTSWQAVADTPIVKLYSHTCLLKSKVRTGSGILLMIDGERFVLTNSHVPYHGDKDQDICHEAVFVRDGDTLQTEITLSAVDFTLDLALLKIAPNGFANIPDANFINTDDMYNQFDVVSNLVEFGQPKVKIEGFAATNQATGSPQRIVAAGEIKDPDYYLSVHPRIENLVLLSGLAERGMSGGGVFDLHGNLVAILSQQVMVLAPGKTPTLSDLARASDVIQTDTGDISAVMYPLAISVDVVMSWLRSMRDEQTSRLIGVDLHEQKNSVFAVTIDGIQYRDMPCSTSAAALRKDGDIGGDAIGIGGEIDIGDLAVGAAAGIDGEHEGDLVAGGDASGIGGIEDEDLAHSAKQRRSCGVAIVPTENPGHPWLFRELSWYKYWKDLIEHKHQLGCRMHVRHIRTADGARLPVWSVTHYLTLLNRGVNIPLLRISSCSHKDLTRDEEQLKNIGQELLEAASSIKAYISEWDDAPSEIVGILESATQIGDDLKNERFEFVSETDLRLLTDTANNNPMVEAWHKLFNDSRFGRNEFRRALDLRKLLLQAQGLLDEVRITPAEAKEK